MLSLLPVVQLLDVVVHLLEVVVVDEAVNLGVVVLLGEGCHGVVRLIEIATVGCSYY